MPIRTPFWSVFGIIWGKWSNIDPNKLSFGSFLPAYNFSYIKSINQEMRRRECGQTDRQTDACENGFIICHTLCYFMEHVHSISIIQM